MIVPMKKGIFIVQEKDQQETLEKMRDAGVVHLERDTTPVSSETLTSEQMRLESIKYALEILPEEEIIPLDSPTVEIAEEYLNQILSLDSNIKEIDKRFEEIENEIKFLEEWDSIDPTDLKHLDEKDVFLRFFDIPESKLDEIPEGVEPFILGFKKKRVNLLLISRDLNNMPADWDEITFPKKSISEMLSEEKTLDAKKVESTKQLEKLAIKRKILEWYMNRTIENFDFEEAKLLTSEQSGFACMTGYFPSEDEEEIKKIAHKNLMGLILDEPKEDDPVPTKLRFGKFSSILSPVLDFLGILPGYRELDISFFFTCFFSVFTAMLIGDAGYGLIFLTVTFMGMIGVAWKKKPMPKIFFLMLLLSITTITWGVITGTWFASKALMNIDFFNNLKLDIFKSSEEEQISLLMAISFFLGIVQLLIGVIQNFKKNFPKLKSFAQIGWFAVLVSVYYLVLTLVVKREGLEAYPTEMIYVLLGGVGFIFIFGSQEEGIGFFKGILNSFANFLQLFLDVVGTFSDLMSYVRLFAVGLASVKIAETFNQLGSNMAGSWTIVFGILIIVIGHTLNIVLGLMAILVHAVRLNILEYSGKVGVEWSGFKYKPFKVCNDNKS